MMGFTLMLLFAPLIAISIGLMIGLLFFLALCLIVIGATGAAMNKLYMRQTHSKDRIIKKFNNAGAIITGIFLLMLPFGVILFSIVDTVTNAG